MLHPQLLQLLVHHHTGPSLHFQGAIDKKRQKVVSYVQGFQECLSSVAALSGMVLRNFKGSMSFFYPFSAKRPVNPLTSKI